MILRIYIEYILAVIGFILFSIFLFSKRSVFNTEKLKGKQLDFAKKHGKTVNLIVRIICVVVLTFALVIRIVPLTLDIPSVIFSNYKETIVEVVKNDIGNPDKPMQRDVVVRDIVSEEELTIHVYYTQIQRGDILKVKILPCSKFGDIIEKME